MKMSAREENIETLEAAWAYIERNFPTVPDTGIVAITRANGLILSEDVVSRLDVPRYRHAAMDGYSVGPDWFRQGSTDSVAINGRSEPGKIPSVRHGQGASKVFTGAPLSSDTYAVIPEENCTTDSKWVRLKRAPNLGEHIREAGEDFRCGQTVLFKGTRLGAPQLALAAAANHRAVCVFRRLRVGIVITGNEVVSASPSIGEGKIIDSNGPLLAALAEDLGLTVTAPVHVSDSEVDIAAALKTSMAQNDILIVSGGMASSDLDHTAKALHSAGGAFSPVRVRLRPGKPARLGLLEGRLVIGLPGNPFAAFVAMKALGETAIRQAVGLRNIRPKFLTLKAGFSYLKPSATDEFLTATLGFSADETRVQRITPSGSARLIPLSIAQGLCRLKAQQSEIAEGTPVEWWPFATMTAH